MQTVIYKVQMNGEGKNVYLFLFFIQNVHLRIEENVEIRNVEKKGLFFVIRPQWEKFELKNRSRKLRQRPRLSLSRSDYLK